MKFKNILFATALLLASNTISAATTTWGIVTTYSDLVGSITFDDSPISGLSDGDYDASDTHIFGATLTLTSSLLGINYLDTNATFQPLTNTFDNKHIDSCHSCTVSSNIGNIGLTFSANSDQGNPANGVSEYWLTVAGDNSYRWAFTDGSGVNNDTNIPSSVPVPAAIWFMGSGLLGLMGFSRKNKKLAA